MWRGPCWRKRRQPGSCQHRGTESSPTPEEAGSQLELTVGGKQPVPLPNGETRSFLEDGDTVILRAWCEKPGFVRIGFAECRSTVVPAVRSALLIDGAGETTGADGWGGSDVARMVSGTELRVQTTYREFG
jgi:hypothetical protein